MRSGDADEDLDVGPEIEAGPLAARPHRPRKQAPLWMVFAFAGSITLIFAFIARFFQDIPAPPPVSAIIVRVPLAIDTSPDGARVTADDHELGVTPLRSSLPVGVHAIELDRDGYAPLRRRVELVPGSPLAAQFPLKPLFGTLRVITDAKDAEVMLDGRPLTGVDEEFDADSVPPGRHKLTISSANARASLAFQMNPATPPTVEVPQASNLKVAVISRFADNGTVISSEPAKVAVTNGPSIQAGPEAKPLPVGPNQHVELAGTGLARRVLPATHAAVPSLGVLAALQTGSIVVAADSDATVSLNGKASTRHPQNGRLYFWGLMPGRYVVRISKPGVADRSITMNVEKDKQASTDSGPSRGTSAPVVARIVKPSPLPVPRKVVPPPAPEKHPRTEKAENSEMIVRATHPAPVKTEAPLRTPVKTEAAPKPAPIRPSRPTVEGVVRFTVRTPGVRLTVRRVDVPDPLTRLIVTDSLRLPAGRWVLNATAPGFQAYTATFLVNPAGPADIFINLKPEHGGKKKHFGR